MIQVTYEKYWTDNHYNTDREMLDTLHDLGKWILRKMRCDYSGDSRAISVPSKESMERGLYSLVFRPEYGGPRYTIQMIEKETGPNGKWGIILSDGTYTSGQKHCSKEVEEWFAEFEAERRSPAFDFIE